jgi:hypothetical protein
VNDIYEWEFPEPSHLVDLERVCREVSDIPFVTAQLYMNELHEKAPIVYGRLKEYALKTNQLKWHKWR